MFAAISPTKQLGLADDVWEELATEITHIIHSAAATQFTLPLELTDYETDYKGNRQLIELCNSINEPLTFSSRPERMNAILTSAAYGNVKIVSMREANRLYSGTDRIEDSYFFATAEVKANGNGTALEAGGRLNGHERN